ncbi:MAG: SHOCT domain-containing protein [Senegalia sp. (in: firmicutes)]|uniref:SHOCT domain-containing protein n=1 Tax=Senegalia sp. (in: firmicutes) TaxID=1924098 RepID=UPI003F96C787
MHGFMDTGWNDMMNFGSRMSGWFIVYDIVKLLIIVAVVIVLARMFIKNSSGNNNSSSNRATDILKERYAKGEISEEEYKTRLKNLK